jgi:hypothetical protein
MSAIATFGGEKLALLAGRAVKAKCCGNGTSRSLLAGAVTGRPARENWIAAAPTPQHPKLSGFFIETEALGLGHRSG